MALQLWGAGTSFAVLVSLQKCILNATFTAGAHTTAHGRITAIIAKTLPGSRFRPYCCLKKVHATFGPDDVARSMDLTKYISGVSFWLLTLAVLRLLAPLHPSPVLLPSCTGASNIFLHAWPKIYTGLEKSATAGWGTLDI